MSNFGDLTTVNWEYMFDLLFLPACILVIALLVGIILNRFVNKRIEEKSYAEDDDNVEESLKSVFINALKGVPISFCLVA